MKVKVLVATTAESLESVVQQWLNQQADSINIKFVSSTSLPNENSKERIILTIFYIEK